MIREPRSAYLAAPGTVGNDSARMAGSPGGSLDCMPENRADARGLQLGSGTLRPADVASMARLPDTRQFVIDPVAASRVDGSVRLRDRLVSSGVPIYGVTTGFGDSNT